MRWSVPAALSFFSLVGCGSLDAAPDDGSMPEPVAPAPVSPPDPAAPAAPVVPDGSCKLVTNERVAMKDTVVFADACDHDMSYGETDGLNAYVAPALFVFPLTTPDLKAIIRGEFAATLVFETKTDCRDCGIEGLDTKTGTLDVHAMRSDWDEGKSTGRTGADGCRRTAATATTPAAGWGKATAPNANSKISSQADYDPFAAGFTHYAADATKVEVALSAKAIVDFRNLKGEGTLPQIAFYVKSDAQIVLAARESARPAHLRLMYCE